MNEQVQDDERVMSLVERTLALPTGQREAYLKSVCPDDVNLFTLVWTYIKSEERMNGFLVNPFETAREGRDFRFQPGDILDNRFRILREIAQGGMGVVYEAVDQRLERRIALKCAKAGFAEQLFPEVRNAREIGHPNVCKIFEIYSTQTSQGQTDFITMEFLEGETLAVRLLRGPMSKKEARGIALELCAGVAEAHRKGVIHGDLKTNNVILTPIGRDGVRAVITDFGLARNAVASLNDSNWSICGTPGYMAPELLKGEKPSVLSDIYALGAVFCDMLGGRKPHEATAHYSPEMSPAIKASPLDRSTSRDDILARTHLPVRSTWDRILLRCLDPNPTRRFQSADEVFRALSPSRARRRWMVAGAFLALFAIFCGVFWWQRTSNSGDAPRLPLRQLTAGDVDTSVSLSPDAKQVVYSSDRSGNLNLWLQDLSGGEPVRLTSDGYSQTAPVFSPDGKNVAFRSERGGGGIYVTAITGKAHKPPDAAPDKREISADLAASGESIVRSSIDDERLVGAGGRDPSYSPDGKWIAYWQGLPTEGDLLRAGSAKSFIAPARGGVPRQIASDLANSGFPLFSPDSQYLLVRSQLVNRVETTYFLVNTATGKSRELTIANEVGRRGLSNLVIQAWTKSGIFFRASRGDETSIWYAPAAPDLQLTGAPQLLASSMSETSHLSISGRKLAFFNGSRRNAIWLLPVETNTGRTLGPLSRVTSARPGILAHPELSPDGRWLVFRVFSTRGVDLVLRDLETGDERVVAQRERPELAGRFLRDNSSILLEIGPAGDATVRQWDLHSHKLTDLIEHASALGPSADGRWLSYWARKNSRTTSIRVAEVATGVSAEILSEDGSQLYVPHISPDGRWICFLARNGPQQSRIFVAPFRGLARIEGSEWIPISQKGAMDDKPEWSPNEALLYFVSDRDGYRCVWAQRVARTNKRPIGPPFPIQHFHELRSSMQNVNLGHQALSVAADKIGFLLSEQSGGIWTADLPHNIP